MVVVAVVHCEYEVEAFEVVRANLSAAMRQVQPPACGVHAHALVGQVAGVV